MKMITWLLLGALSASAALNVYQATTQYSQAAPSPATPGETELSDVRLIDKLELTDQQKRQFADCCPAISQQQAQLNEKITALLASLERELQASSPNNERIQQIANPLPL